MAESPAPVLARPTYLPTPRVTGNKLVSFLLAGHRLPTAAWICAAVAFLNAASWAFITPPFEVPDEPYHFAYVKQLAETGHLPISSSDLYSPEEGFVLRALHYPQIRMHPIHGAISSRIEQEELDEVLDSVARYPKAGSPAAGVAASEPPLYYALESIPYSLGSGGTLLDRLQLMRLLSALMASATALFTFLFVREALPRVRSAWTVGALAVALSPLLGFMSGAVNPDAMLFAVSAALFYCLARAFRRGLDMRLAIATGLVIATGLLTKLNFVGIAPGAFVALAMMGLHGARRRDRRAFRAAASALAIGSLPIVVYLLVHALARHPTLGLAGGAVVAAHRSVLAEANYVWQLYLPRLPGTVNDFPGLSNTAVKIWLDGFVGRLGWLETYFPAWVYTVALAFSVLIAGLCARAVLAARAALRPRAGELAAYLLMTLGLLVLIGASSYVLFPGQDASYGQARYLLPLLPLFGAALALAARGAPRHWRPAVGTLIVVLFLTNDLFGQLQTIARYYG